MNRKRRVRVPACVARVAYLLACMEQLAWVLEARQDPVARLERDLAMKVVLGSEEPSSSADVSTVDPRILARFFDEHLKD